MSEQGLDYDALLEENRSFLFLDPPDHTRLRSLVTKAFTPRVVEELRPRILGIVTELIDAALERGGMDVMEDFAYPLPVAIICDMLGVPVEDNVRFREWTREAARSLDPDFVLPQEEIDRAPGNIRRVRRVLPRAWSRRAAPNPKDDLISALIAAEDEGSKLNEEELISTCILLLIAGHETTVNLIGNGTLATPAPSRPAAAAARDDPALIKTAVEELLRFDPPVQLTGRLALEDLQFGGKTLKKGQQATILIGAANRDPDAVRRPAAPRHHATGQPPHRVRPRHPLLPRLAARARRRPDRTRRTGRAACRTSSSRSMSRRTRRTWCLRGLAELPVRC